MSLYYADTSAALKLLVEETHSQALAAFYDADPQAVWVSSALLRIELVRALRRAAPALLPAAEELLTAFSYIAMSDDVVEGARSEPDPMLRSLDAIHLATARLLASELDAFLTYDERLRRAATAAGILTASPQ